MCECALAYPLANVVVAFEIALRRRLLIVAFGKVSGKPIEAVTETVRRRPSEGEHQNKSG
jgi:hypothetical protein